ncbi:mandelate racemase/muconate lactonizing enzyme family protein [Horticoccus sp. 23ND18S-11]|uniref:mandelate racemase/muconate lactonizing enzyme family protein n=1 Tax=Horticoccus sp. 23ND18S-11 TaxID=3391832 RepID=UPI0039C99A72
MKSNRRHFLATALAGSAAAALPARARAAARSTASLEARYAQLDVALKKPVLRRELFPSPVLIASMELLRFNHSFLCRVRSKDGAEGISVSNNSQMMSTYPIHVNRLQSFFIGKDARDLEAVMEEAYVHQSNYKLQSLALWVPMATIEFAVLDLLGRIAQKPLGLLISDTVHHPTVQVYRANGERDNSAEEVMRNLKRQVEESQARALKIKIGGRMSHPEFPAGRSEKLIPMVRNEFGDRMVCYADSNGSYDVAEGITFGRLLEEYKFAFYEEPVPFDWYEETKAVADAVGLPVAGGEQEASLHAFRWLIANDGLDIVQPDVYYFGGLIRSTKVARMAAAMGKTCVPHISGGLGYLYMIHFVSAIANAGPFHEFKGLSQAIPFECKTSSLKTDGGVVTVPTGPGSGIEIDPDFIKKHTVVKRDAGRADE